MAHHYYYNISTLPVSTIKLANQLGIELVTYESGKEIIELMCLKQLCDINNGFSVYVKEIDKWYIFFDGNMQPKTHIRFTIAHELGHILLGHELKLQKGINNTIQYTDENRIKERKKTIEIEADMFALRLLAPACVLWGLNIKEAEDIMILCGVPLNFAKHRAKRLKELYRRDKFLTNNLEKQVFSQFKKFIEGSKFDY